ncbi:hypothetical protein AnigIFM63604_002607, partial [Aspergillus niger]
DKIVQLKAECRTALIDYFACHVGSLDSPALSALVAAFGVPRNEFYSEGSSSSNLECE